MAHATQPTSAMQAVLGALSLPRRWRVGVGPMIAGIVLLVIVASALLAPLYVPYDPMQMNSLNRLQPASAEHLLGTDQYGRDLFSRIMIGGRVSLLIGVGAALFSVLTGMLIGLVSGFFRMADAIIMRIMDSLMAIPAILLAIALVALNGPSVWSVIVAITIPEVPRVVRLVRSVVLSAREEPYVEAAVALGSGMFKILGKHLMPNTLPALIVQGTYICASAILTEALLSFLGAGVSTEIPTWGNIMAEGRTYFQINPGLIFWTGAVLSLCILSINLLGDTARDMLDPRLKRRET
ncbi:ABC transporter permease [Halomonas sp. A29]|uniref:ABC transporter permease n=1 Tax=Halomonas sp. A29 TaxID=3102786 RepID=UPI00398AB708